MTGRHNPTPSVDSRYGAPMGRHTGPAPSGEGQRWCLRRVAINAGGYDPGGAYWGLGAPLYWAMNDDGEEAFFRVSRADMAEAFAALGGVRIGEAGYDDFARRYDWARDGLKLAARHIVRRDYDPGARFYGEKRAAV